MKHAFGAAALAAVLSLAAVPAAAGDDIMASCRVAFSGLDVLYDPFAAQASPAIGTVDVECRGVNGQIAVTIDASPGSSGSYAHRTMEAGHDGDSIAYNLYYNGSGRIFGDGHDGTAHYQRVLSAERGRAADSFSVQLIVPPHQDAANGAYSDSLALDVEL